MTVGYRLVQDYEWGCKDCGGCTDDECRGGCGQRWCGGSYQGKECDRCAQKVEKEGCPGSKTGQLVKVRCNGRQGHRGRCHWAPREVGGG